MPAPKTTQVVPGCTAAVLIAAPSPVESPQAKRQTCSKGASGLTLASAISGITVYSAKVEQPMKWRISSSPREIRVLPSGRKPLFCCSRIAMQRLVRGSTQCTHSPHWGEKRVTTWSPSASEVTSGPTRSTTPAPSWPSTVGA